MAVAESDEQLLARWRETLKTVLGFDGQPLDPVDRQTLNELRRQLERAEAELDRRGLRRTGQERDGSWQPLPMHEPAPPAPAPQVELTWEPREELGFNHLLETVTDPNFERSDWDSYRSPRWQPSAALVREWERERERELPFFGDSEPLTHRQEPPFVPDLADGLTADQRLLIERLAQAPLPQDQLLADAPESTSLARALEELRLTRRYPLVAEQGGSIELTPLAKCLVSFEPGRVRVHGGFFPNLLANGAADAFAFPEYEVARIIGAASLLMEHPDTPDQDVAHALGSPVNLRGAGPWFSDGLSRFEREKVVGLRVGVRQWSVSKRLDLRFPTAADAERAAERLRLAQERHEFDEGTQYALTDAMTLVVTLPPGVEGVAVVRRLSRDRALESWWRLDTTCAHEGEARTRTARELVEVFVRRSRAEVLRRLRREKLPADDRLEIVEGLLRVAGDERLAALIDAAETKDEGIWALTHVRGEPFSERQARAIVSTTGLHRRQHLLTLEREALLEELSSRLSPFRPSELDRLVHEQFSTIRSLAEQVELASCKLG